MVKERNNLSHTFQISNPALHDYIFLLNPFSLQVFKCITFFLTLILTVTFFLLRVFNLLVYYCGSHKNALIRFPAVRWILAEKLQLQPLNTLCPLPPPSLT